MKGEVHAAQFRGSRRDLRPTAHPHYSVTLRTFPRKRLRLRRKSFASLPLNLGRRGEYPPGQNGGRSFASRRDRASAANPPG